MVPSRRKAKKRVTVYILPRNPSRTDFEDMARKLNEGRQPRKPR